MRPVIENVPDATVFRIATQKVDQVNASVEHRSVTNFKLVPLNYDRLLLPLINAVIY